MATEVNERMTEAVLENTRATRDILSVRRVFGEAYEMDGRTIIPVARISGGGGGGGGGDNAGETASEDEERAGSGFGSGFGMNARPVGVYIVDEDGVDWKPAVDASRLAKGGQVLAGIMVVCLTIVLWRRSG